MIMPSILIIFIAFFAIIICLKKLPLFEMHTRVIDTKRLRDSVGGVYLVCGYVVVPFKRDNLLTLYLCLSVSVLCLTSKFKL